jgi:hypothetical protein
MPVHKVPNLGLGTRPTAHGPTTYQLGFGSPKSPPFNSFLPPLLPYASTTIDEDILAVHSNSSPKDTNQGPFIRIRAKKLQEQVNSFLTDYNFHTSENVTLPKCPILMMLRFTLEDMEDTWPKDQDTVLQNSSIGKVTRADDRT